TSCYRDWSSDVCSSDLWGTLSVARIRALVESAALIALPIPPAPGIDDFARIESRWRSVRVSRAPLRPPPPPQPSTRTNTAKSERSEERRVGKEGRWRWQ